MIRTYPIALAALVLSFTAAIAGCQGETPSAAAPTPSATIPQLIRQPGGVGELMELSPGQVPGAEITQVKEFELPSILETSGQVTFDDRRVSTIVSRVSGRIVDVRVSQWDTVRRGEPIVQLYSPDFMTAEAELLEAEATATQRAAKGEAADDITKAMISAARRKLGLLGMEEADIDLVKEPNPTLWVRAPIGGIVVENKAVRGAAVSPGDVLYTLGTLADVWIVGDIYEDDLARVHVGQQLEAVTTAFPEEVFRGTIARISPNIDPATHTLQIRCAVKNPGMKLKPQMLARVKIVTVPGTALVVPQDALIFETDSYFAFVEVEPGKFEHRRVVVKSWDEHGYARIVSGLKPGDRVISGETLQVNALWHQAHGESS